MTDALLADVGGSTARARWLELAYQRIRADLLPEAPDLELVVLSWSFPSRGARGRVIGECHDGVQGARERWAIVIHPSQWASSRDVLAVLAHEMCHAATPGDGHGRRFRELVTRIGLVGKPTQTRPGPAFLSWAQGSGLGALPLGTINPNASRRVQGTRQRLWECSCPRPVKVRCASDWLDATCGNCGQRFELKQGPRAPRGGGAPGVIA